MSGIGNKRPADSQLGPENVANSTNSPTTTPTTDLGFMFRPSPLSQAASNLSTFTKSTLDKAKLSEPTLSLNFSKPKLMSPHSPKPLGGINGINPSPHLKRKLDEDSPTDSSSAKRSNLFIQCMEQFQQQSTPDNEEDKSHEESEFVFGKELSSRVTANSTAIKENATPSPVKSSIPDTMVDAIKDTNDDDDDNKESGNINSTILTFRGGQSSPSLPEVEMVTGEEGERHVVQITCKLFAFDKANRTWKEKGRGEVRLNDSPQSEGVFQSRLIMRASGNYRVLLNTNLWCKMTCEKASPQSFRLTAQETDGQFGIYLIKGASKDIHHLYSAIDQRLQALHKLSKESASTSPSNEPHLPKDKTPHPPGSYDEDDSVLGDRACLNSSPDSSPDHKRFQERLGEPSSTPSPYYPEQNFNNQTTTDPFTGTSESSQVAIVTPLTDGNSNRPTSDDS